VPVHLLNGRRITDKATMELLNLTYSGLNKSPLANLQAQGCTALGHCGADANSVLSEKRKAAEVDCGFVGDIVRINTGFRQLLLQQEIVPVFSAITCTEEGVLLNTKADSVATEISKAMSETFDT